jgi:hypothetical protein
MHVLKSRKFWASLVGLAAVIVLYASGQVLDEETIVNAIVAITGIFVGSTAIEDAARSLGKR